MIIAEIYAPIPHCGQLSSTVIILLVFCTLFIIVSLSIGRKLLIFITSTDIPCFSYNYLEASSETPTILENATMVRSFPYFSTLAFPISSTKFGSKLYYETSKLDPYKI